jgi:ribonuclease HI
MKAQIKKVTSTIRIFTDGAGCRPDKKGSGFAWLREDTGQKAIIRKDGLTNNQAEYHAIRSAVESLSPGAKAEILTDSENTCFQLRGERRVRDPHLGELHEQIQVLIKKNRLSVDFTWIPRRENRAGRLI